MTLFVPRKQDITGTEAGVKDAINAKPVVPDLGNPIAKSYGPAWDLPKPDLGHLEKALRQNFLAIQNWANQRTVSAAVRGSTSETVANNVWFQPAFDHLDWDYNNIASTSGQSLVVPETGIYALGVGASFSSIPGQTHLSVSINGGTYPAQHGFVSGSTAASWTGMIGASQQKFTKGKVLTPAVIAAMPGATDTCQVVLNEFSLTKLADIPSKVQ